MIEKKTLLSLKDASLDVITHKTENDQEYISKLLNSSLFTDREIQDINTALKSILGDEKLSEGKKLDYTQNLWRVNFYEKPPTVDELITHEWLGLAADNIFPYIKDMLKTFFDPTTQYRHLVLYLAIGVGKTSAACLAILLISIWYSLLLRKKQYLNLAEFAPVAIALLSFTQEKANDTMVKPLANLLGGSKRFYRCAREDILIKKIKEQGQIPGGQIFYTTAGEGSVFRMGDLLFKQISDKSQIVGLNLLAGILTEINFFLDRGVSSKYVSEFYWDLRTRIQSRLGNHYMARSILDSSVNTFDNELEKWIYYNAKDDPENLVYHKSKWQLQPWLSPIFEKDKSRVFPVYRGNSAKVPKILTLDEVQNQDSSEIIWVPEDYRSAFTNNLNKSLRDLASWPGGSDSKLISNHDLIESLFTPSLKNFYTFEYAPASKPPEGLLWNLVKSQFFVPTGKKAGDSNLYQFWRYPNADRFVSIDLAQKKDMASISMCHLERLKKGTHAGEKIYVVDFTLPILATKEEINLDAFKFLIHDMAKYGGIQFKRISYDQFQSVTSQQYLTRHGFDVERFSVDISVEPYYSFVSYMQQGRVKLGRNLIIKNNLKSLVNKKEDGKKLKVDHEQGNWFDLENQDWTTSKAGYFGKDGSDSLVACIGLADLYGTDSADYFWNEEEEQLKLERGSSSLVLADLKKRWNLTPVRR